MDAVKQLLLTRFKTLTLILVAISFSLVLLMLRIKLHQSFFFLFLIWNLFLAVIPYLITLYLSAKPHLSLWTFILGFMVWVLFLPNAPYIVTDLIHLRRANGAYLWLDILVVLSFALSALFLFYLTLIDMQHLIKANFKTKLPIVTLTNGLLFLCSFGVYLGRFLRYNSWDIISAPQSLFTTIFNMLKAPYQHQAIWLFTLGFGCFLSLGFWIFKHIRSPQQEQTNKSAIV
ncbi:MAG: DUF1361 domain-containing protein [Winogradskyella arenosi]